MVHFDPRRVRLAHSIRAGMLAMLDGFIQRTPRSIRSVRWTTFGSGGAHGNREIIRRRQRGPLLDDLRDRRQAAFGCEIGTRSAPIKTKFEAPAPLQMCTSRS
jgi:hypothetical protein